VKLINSMDTFSTRRCD